ncbi:hypothetical protein G7K_4533-t1 [Saitoella complicata NRRL Y-17804]|uniref:PQ loop repeat protein n=1 Tax=Saitoella complicata (strain BCRC 22490 / CBS 7301 / JCM 7358 / NBRC 10748 / NRRL Y-17804) TaxID=698492 RepID=A0A0E9NKL7_SAICN|nr:hypothetical protein G7K_4533-t1 [Saitoella complicata NRRL Y-17804]
MEKDGLLCLEFLDYLPAAELLSLAIRLKLLAPRPKRSAIRAHTTPGTVYCDEIKAAYIHPIADEPFMTEHIGTAANVLGTIGTVCWCVQLVPQIWTNWRRKSTTGLSPWMLMLWAVAAPPYGIYAIVQQLNIPLQIQPQLFGILSLITWAQCLHYENKVAAWNCWVYTIVLSVLFGGIEAGCIVGLRIPYDDGVTWPITLIGVIAVVLIVAGLCPPYIDIWKHRSVRGISFYFLSIDMSGALFSFLSLVFQTFDILAAVNYILVFVMEIGIILCHVGFVIRDRRRAKREGTVKKDEETPTEGADIADVVTQEHEGHHTKAADDKKNAAATA